MEDPSKDKRNRKLLRVCILLLEIYEKKNFSHMAKPLNKLKGKKKRKWEMEHQEAFDELKEKIASQPILALPKREGKFQVETNASEYAIGGVLSQE